MEEFEILCYNVSIFKQGKNYEKNTHRKHH